MNGRILELAKNPTLFQITDLELINSEINKHPYIQSLRALHLFGTHRLQPENYTAELSKTAAYTTDKKILYQLINSAEITKPSVDTISEPVIEKEITSEEPKHKFTEIESVVVETPKSVFVNGELNRILFEGEEDFLERETETIDLESTIESGEITLQKPDSEIFTEEKTAISETNDAENFSKETLIKEEIIAEEKPIIEDSSEISFHATAAFLPEVKIVSNPEKIEVQEIAKPVLNKHEEEMKRLIAEVEQKIKASKKTKTISDVNDETQESAVVNFSETQRFEFSKTEEQQSELTEIETIKEEPVLQSEPKVATKPETPPAEIPQEPIEIKADSRQEQESTWKPMSFSTNTPDALISTKSEEIPLKKAEKTELVKAETPSPEQPIFKVSSFSENVLESNKEEEETQPIPTEEKNAKNVEDSNVPTFINTWQNWLKIDRAPQVEKEKIEIAIIESKNNVIDNFIEKQPKISKLKEESDFIIKEKTDDISHLMTDTLAKLYTEQKLFAKAIKAYGVLSEKHPEKKAFYDDKINKVKELRQNK